MSTHPLSTLPGEVAAVPTPPATDRPVLGMATGDRVSEVAKVLRILVVEDEPMIGWALSEMLEEMGHEVCALETTEEGAVHAALRCGPDLMIVDAGLVQGSGVAAVEEILRTTPIPYFFISGGHVRGARPDAMVLGKPFFEPDLRRAIEHVLGRPPAA